MSYIRQFKKKVMGNLRSLSGNEFILHFSVKRGRVQKPVPLLQEPAKTTIR